MIGGRHRRADPPASIECRELVGYVTEYLEGAVSADLRATIDHHLALCDGCTEFVHQMRQTAAAARGAETSRLDPGVRSWLLQAFRDEQAN